MYIRSSHFSCIHIFIIRNPSMIQVNVCISFSDENFAVSHDRRGIVGMANKDRHTNGSQFYITLQPAKWMDTKYVAFG